MGKRGVSGAIMRGLGAKDHAVTIVGKTTLAPDLVQVRMTSPTLLAHLDAGPTAWVRFWFPGTESAAREYQRGYTILNADTASGEFNVNFVLHEPAGPASAWAAKAKTGDTVQAMIYGSARFEMSGTLAAGYLIIGDSASMPAIGAIFEALPDGATIECYLEEHSSADHQIPLPDHPGATIHWVPRQSKESLARTIVARDYSGWYAWIAPEAGSLKALRPRLKNEFGFDKTNSHVQAYWSEGRTMGSERGTR
ncbi:siderophore-interacting protein [Propionimicrobium sp. PCR01-08-3]|uniref:siderophore-interacting protein n=1 Tax=Propionimicrobium sp. PCR01-08-3 TaxID=3052086 RepID=UPI00255C90BC|nr:siderophore-interacting protein [Propionimicrobium sp. PCR01-08-3]WIY84057.1 siderophore-interacting protein [Propionimicrobium sp. PCR01-08-3]